MCELTQRIIDPAMLSDPGGGWTEVDGQHSAGCHNHSVARRRAGDGIYLACMPTLLSQPEKHDHSWLLMSWLLLKCLRCICLAAAAFVT